MAKVLTSTLKDMSNEGVKIEGERLVEEFKRMKGMRIDILKKNPLADNATMDHAFEELEDFFLETKRLILAEGREDAVSSTSGGREYRRDSTKKETVRIPSFKGDERCSLYMNFPIWKKQWKVVIEEYEYKWRSGLLWDHLDDAARSRYVGCETDYLEAMRRLERYYADPQKVIAVVMREVTSQPLINSGEYKNLVSYSSVSKNNFNRLRSLELEYEMSNTSTMTLVVRKFPRSVAERWNEHLSSLEPEIKRKPFEAFVYWL